MTTIALTENHVAADGLITCSGAVVFQDDKKILVDKDTQRVYVMAGTTCMFDALVNWHKKGADPEQTPSAPDGKWSLLVIERNSAPLHYGYDAPYPERIPIPYAIGTGSSYAMGALKAGASAQRAVEIACEIDIHSGGEIQVVNIKEALGMAPRLVETG